MLIKLEINPKGARKIMAKDPDNKYLYDVAQSNLGTVVVPSDIEEQTEKALSNKGFAKSMSLTCLCASLFSGRDKLPRL